VQYPLDLPIDELVTWKQLTGDRRLADALGQCDEKGWDALPLPAKELGRLFPSLWPTPKAAERWGAKNPPKAYRDIIRVWGVLNDYSATRPDKLVQGGGPARGRSRCGHWRGVLEVPAADIRLRDRIE